MPSSSCKTWCESSVCTGRRPEPIAETVAEIRAFGGEAFDMTCDSSNRERVKEVVAKTVETYGTVDVVVNNAQAVAKSAPVEETTYELMYLAWSTGTIGSLNFMQECFPYMKEQHEGRIINFASATGMFGYAGNLAYGSNKEAVRGLQQRLQQKNGVNTASASTVYCREQNPRLQKNGHRNSRKNIKQSFSSSQCAGSEMPKTALPCNCIPGWSGFLLLFRTMYAA